MGRHGPQDGLHARGEYAASRFRSVRQGVAEALHAAAGVVRSVAHVPGSVRALFSGTGHLFRALAGALQGLLRFLQGHVGGVGLIAGQLLSVRQRLQTLFRGRDFIAGVVHLGGGLVQRDLKVVRLFAVLAIFPLCFLQLFPDQLHFFRLDLIYFIEFFQAVVHTVHGLSLGTKSGLAGLHVGIKDGQLPADLL